MTIFDVVTVACFLAMAVAFFTVLDSNQRILPHFLISGLAFAIANQLGNKDQALFAVVVIAAGIAYAVYAALRRN